MISFRLIALAATAAAITACSPPQEAPDELTDTPVGDVNLFLFANFDNEDPGELARGMEAMKEFLEGLEETTDLAMDSPVADRAFTIAALEEENWGGAPHWTGHDTADQLPVALAVRSAFDGDAHADLVGLEDQTPLESSSSAAYVRSFLTDFDGWLAGDVDKLETSNAIHRDNILLDLHYTAFKDYRMVEMEDGTIATVARSWITEQYENTDPNDTMDFFSNIEVTIPSGDGTLRYNCLWGAVIFDPVVAETLLVNTVRNGMQESYEKTDEYLADE
ncbi:MAG: hypothetical protein GY898_08240 [Proteobacteria bacterium]|nr:hypothetical protein [Pseudomonadota bacterium]